MINKEKSNISIHVHTNLGTDFKENEDYVEREY